MKSRQCVWLASVLALVVVFALPVVAQSTRPGQSESAKRVSVNFKDVDIRNAVEVLFEGSGLNYAIEPGVRGTVNVRLVDVPFTDALSAVLKAATMTVRKENGVYMIGPQKAETASEAASAPLSEEPEIERQKILEKIQIGYADVVDIGNIFGVGSVSSRASSGFGGSGSSGFGSGSSFGGNSNSSFGNSSGNRNSGSSFGGGGRSGGSGFGGGSGGFGGGSGGFGGGFGR